MSNEFEYRYLDKNWLRHIPSWGLIIVFSLMSTIEPMAILMVVTFVGISMVNEGQHKSQLRRDKELADQGLRRKVLSHGRGMIPSVYAIEVMPDYTPKPPTQSDK